MSKFVRIESAVLMSPSRQQNFIFHFNTDLITCIMTGTEKGVVVSFAGGGSLTLEGDVDEIAARLLSPAKPNSDTHQTIST